MSREEIYEVLADTVAKHKSIPRASFNENTKLVDIGVKSFECVILKAVLQDKFGINLALADLMNAQTLDEMAGLAAKESEKK